ncbi:hypothetical protein WJX73_001129 [Symbiochloris irregularis]|uniref:Protein CLP1 homolog n=1 Tax=Symbiochloris irregularis TaxID=706552 RepID=A0AAW1Q1C8_9CHLO
MATSTSRTFQLPATEELRLEVRQGHTILIKLLDGTAEIFGTELYLGTPIELHGQKTAVYTWHGCKLELLASGSDLNEALESVYPAGETPMQEYVNVHSLLEQRRATAKEAGPVYSARSEGPRTLLVGPTDVGKSSLCKILCNYAVRMQWSPTMIDLDIGQGAITAPGSIGATPIEAPLDIEEGPPLEVPLIYYYGHVTPSVNPDLYRHLVECLAALLKRRHSMNLDAANSGLVINTMGWVTDLGLDLLYHTIKALQVDVILVLGDDKLYNTLHQHCRQSRNVTVFRLPKSGGVVVRDPTLRKTSRTNRVREYFYGPRNRLRPHSQTVSLRELSIYRIGGGPQAPSSALPIGMKAFSEPLRFLYVTDVDPVRQTVTYLAPCLGPVPGKYLLLGSLKVMMQ